MGLSVTTENNMTREHKLQQLHMHDPDPWERRVKYVAEVMLEGGFKDEADHFDVIADNGETVARVNRNSNRCLNNLCLILTAPRMRRALEQCRNIMTRRDVDSEIIKEIEDLINDASGLNPELWGESW